jgi:hypothetical protein
MDSADGWSGLCIEACPQSLQGGVSRESPEGKSHFLVVRDRFPGELLDLYGGIGRIGLLSRMSA